MGECVCQIMPPQLVNLGSFYPNGVKGCCSFPMTTCSMKSTKRHTRIFVTTAEGIEHPHNVKNITDPMNIAPNLLDLSLTFHLLYCSVLSSHPTLPTRAGFLLSASLYGNHNHNAKHLMVVFEYR